MHCPAVVYGPNIKCEAFHCQNGQPVFFRVELLLGSNVICPQEEKAPADFSAVRFIEAAQTINGCSIHVKALR